MSNYPSHEKQISRINRVIGQLEGIKRMIEDKRYCVEIMSQLCAARNAIKTIELGVLETHIGHCVTEACCSGNDANKEERIREIINLLQKYE